MIIKGKQWGYHYTRVSEFLGTINSSGDVEEKLEPAQIAALRRPPRGVGIRDW
jgi:hypothetical protein